MAGWEDKAPSAGKEGSEAFEHSREVAWGSFWGIIGTIALKLVSFAYAIYIARAFSQEVIGLFYLSLSVIGLLCIWRDLGLPASLTRYIPFFESRRDWGRAMGLLKVSYVTNAAIGILLFFVIFLLAGPLGEIYNNAGLAEGLRLLAAYIVLENLLKVSTSYLQGRGDIKSCQFIGNVQNITKLVLTVALFSFFGATLATLSAAFVLSFLVTVLASTPIVLRNVSAIPTKWKGELSMNELTHDILPFGITLMFVQSLWAFFSSTDRVLLGYLGNPATSIETVAVYSIATQLALTIMVFPGALGSIFLPVVSRLAGKNDYAAMRQVIQTSQRWMFFITIPIALATMAFAGEMLSAFYGSSYRSGGTAMAIFIMGIMFSIIAYPVALALAAMRLVRLELYVAVVAAVANIIINLLLIPILGMEGAALASAAAFLLSSWMFERYGRQYISYSTPSGVYKLFAAGAVAFALIIFLKPFAASAAAAIPAIGTGEISGYAAKFAYLALLAVMGCIGMVFFGLVALALRSFKPEDIVLLRAACRKARVPPQLVSLAERIASHGVEGKAA